MQRIVDGILFEGKTDWGCWDVHVWESNGHREISARPAIEWTEVGPADFVLPLPGSMRLDSEERQLADERAAAEAEERKQRAQESAARRAKKQCRRTIKAAGYSELATLTYRENQTDERLAKEHFRRWARRMGELIPGFGYCAGFEPQQRGAWHIHAAIWKLPKFVEMKKRMPDGSWRAVKLEGWRVGTAVWRSIVGRDNGLCYIGGKGARAKGARHSLAKMAAYVSKYITKHYEAVPEGKQRYTHSRGAEIPKAERLRIVGGLLDVIRTCFWCEDGEEIVSHHVSRWGDGYWLCTEGGGGGSGPISSPV